MNDLYKRLNIAPDAPHETIRQALPKANPALRGAAEVVLLDPRRRAVYDRNRELLVLIGRLRLDLGLNYTRFWSRREFQDFWQDPEFTPPPSQQMPRRRVDQMMIAQAFHAARKVRHHGRRHAARVRWELLAVALFAAAIVCFFLWQVFGSPVH